MEEQATEYSRRYRGETSSNYQYPVVLGSRNPILTKPNQTKIYFLLLKFDNDISLVHMEAHLYLKPVAQLRSFRAMFVLYM
jgi:hypothetical protein